MSKKKNRKKHQFKYATPPTSAQAQPNAGIAVSSLSGTIKSAPGSIELLHDMAYIKRDVKKTVYLGSSFLAAQLLLWFLFNHTALGPAIYRLVKL